MAKAEKKNGAKSTEPEEQNPLEEAMFTVSLSPHVTHSPTVNNKCTHAW